MMERTPEERIAKALVFHDRAQAKLTSEEREALEILDKGSDIFEEKSGRTMSDEEYTYLINLIPGAQEALNRYSKLMDFFEKVMSSD